MESKYVLVNMVSTNNAFENVSAGHCALASHLKILACLVVVPVSVTIRTLGA